MDPPGYVPVRGIVSDSGPTGFTLRTAGGTGVMVTTSSGTLVVVPHARLRQLRPGSTVFVIGTPGPGGTVSARAVAAVSQLRSGAHVNLSMRVKDCSRRSLDAALGTISATAASAG